MCSAWDFEVGFRREVLRPAGLARKTWLTFRSGSSHTKITIFNDLDDSDCLAHQVPHTLCFIFESFVVGYDYLFLSELISTLSIDRLQIWELGQFPITIRTKNMWLFG